MPIKHIYDTDTMTIDTQAFPLKSLSGPLDNAAIILHLSLLVKKLKKIQNLFFDFIFERFYLRDV